MEDTIDNMKDLLEDREKFRELMKEILSLIRRKSSRPIIDNDSSTDNEKAAKTDKKIQDRRELLRILKNIYESCCDSIAIDDQHNCDKFNCKYQFCMENGEIETKENDNLSILNYEEFLPAKTTNELQNLRQEERKNMCQLNECRKPILVVIYTTERRFTDRRGRRKRLESRNGLKNTPIRVTQHFISSPTQ